MFILILYELNIHISNIITILPITPNSLNFGSELVIIALLEHALDDFFSDYKYGD